MQEYKIGSKKITIHGDGEIFVNGKSTGIKQWQSDTKRYSNSYGSEQKDLKGLDIEKALKKRGLVGSYLKFILFNPQTFRVWGFSN